MAAGLLGSSIMIYMSETSMPQFRGALLASFSLFFAFGQLFLALGLKVLEDVAPLAFQRIFYLDFVFLGLWLGPMLYLPETPGMLCRTAFFFFFWRESVIESPKRRRPVLMLRQSGIA